MRCFVLNSSPRDERLTPVLALLDRAKIAMEPIASAAALRAEPILAATDAPLVLVPHSGDRSLMEAAISLAEQIGSGNGLVVVIADHLDALDYRRLVRSGAGEWSTWAGVADDLAEVVRGDGPGEAGVDRAAKVISCLPSKGGVGNTTLAIELAVRLASDRKRGGAQIGLVDLDLQGGTLAHALDIEPRLDLVAVSKDLSRLDEKLVDVFTTQHSARLDVFASPSRRVEVGSIDPAAIFGTIDLLARRYDALVLDIPQTWMGWTDTLLHGSDLVLATGGSSVPALKRLVGWLGHLDGLPLAADRVAAVVNGCETSVLGRITRRHEIEKILPDRRLFLLPRDGAAAAVAADTGRPLSEVAANSRLSKDLHNLAEWVSATVGLARPPARRGRMFRKAVR